MYENCAGGLLFALVIVHEYIHAVYNCFTVNGLYLIAAYIRRRGAVGNCRGDDRQITH